LTNANRRQRAGLGRHAVETQAIKGDSMRGPFKTLNCQDKLVFKRGAFYSACKKRNCGILGG
jgi:hypothetical protein